VNPTTTTPLTNESSEHDLTHKVGEQLHREKKQRRRNERNAALYDDEVIELLHAVDEWRRKSHRSFPAWSEVLQLLKDLGWRKVASPASHDGAPVASSAASSTPVEPLPPEPNEA
jgi:FMN phosphatase YigB (HAD superfamily)